MLQLIKNNLVAIAGSALIIVGGYMYYAYSSGGSEAALVSTSASAVSQDLLQTLSSLHTIQLDDSIFSNPSFQSLSDFGVVIPPQTVGRQNPFLPLRAAAPIKK